MIDFCGGITSDDFRVLDGGPMMGKLIDENSYAVKKTTKSIVVLPADSIVIEHKVRSIENAVRRAQAICLSCRMCTDLCPRYLLGHDLYPDEMMKKMYRSELGEGDIEKFDFAYLCCDCGLCELYSCVVDLSARALFNHIKAELAAKGIKNTHTRTELAPNDFREYRSIPVARLEKRLEIDRYDSKAPLSDFNADVDLVRLYLVQHVGVPSTPVVAAGEAHSPGAGGRFGRAPGQRHDRLLPERPGRVHVLDAPGQYLPGAQGAGRSRRRTRCRDRRCGVPEDPRRGVAQRARPQPPGPGDSAGRLRRAGRRPAGGPGDDA